uniref:Uncharacterized protein n=1 Tax=Fusarium oxysporum (strain Fo5176) TaxID=660025 RepID=A0A0D2XS96_FUSOF
MAVMEVDGTLDTLARGYDESQFQMPPDCSLEQGTPRGATCGPLSPHEESNPSNQQAPSKNISLPAPNGELELRPASHKSKNRKRRSATPSNQLRARECHNLVEKHYRARLKTQFERLLAVLPAAQGRSLAGRDTAASLGQDG